MSTLNRRYGKAKSQFPSDLTDLEITYLLEGASTSGADFDKEDIVVLRKELEDRRKPEEIARKAERKPTAKLTKDSDKILPVKPEKAKGIPPEKVGKEDLEPSDLVDTNHGTGVEDGDGAGDKDKKGKK